ncbi:hypothetical protein M3_0041 [Lysinibacillus phage vB_LfM_LysYB1]|nr:hypothetical protein M3_0041 [Lysinibacillus phage vB_LfM_LysYB1]WAB25216.1 hypothetical protein M5_0038 [Lysinibacillus phage vB_LfM_LysYB2]
MEKVFVYEGKEFPTFKAIADYRGVKQVTRRDMVRLGITEVEKTEQPEQNAALESTEGKVAETTEAKTSDNKEAEEVKIEKKTLESDAELKEEMKLEPLDEPEKEDAKTSLKKEEEEEELESIVEKRTAEQSDIKQEFSEEVLNEPEKLQKELGYANVDELAADLKRRKAANVIELARSLGLSWKEDSHAGINRMRAAIEIRKKVFPGERRTRAPKSGWKKVPYEVMVKLAKENNLEFRETTDEKINRMWVIKALKDAEIQPPVLEEGKK